MAAAFRRTANNATRIIAGTQAVTTYAAPTHALATYTTHVDGIGHAQVWATHATLIRPLAGAARAYRASPVPQVDCRRAAHHATKTCAHVRSFASANHDTVTAATAAVADQEHEQGVAASTDATQETWQEKANGEKEFGGGDEDEEDLDHDWDKEVELAIDAPTSAQPPRLVDPADDDTKTRRPPARSTAPLAVYDVLNLIQLRWKEKMYHRAQTRPHRVQVDETVEVCLHLNVDVRKADQMVRGATSLPHSHREVKLLVFAEGADAETARASGADEIGNQTTVDEFLEANGKKKAKQWDVMIATQDSVKMLGKVSRLLGPRRLMPTPKAGTLVASADLSDAVKRVKHSYISYRADRFGHISAGVAKCSMPLEDIQDNVLSFVKSILDVRPQAVKAQGYVLKAYMKSHMGPAFNVDVRDLINEASSMDDDPTTETP